jgi:uncharacterized protein YodC (DUF2158 family)
VTSEQYQAGDTVRLKSGGPVMTVEWTDNTVAGIRAACVWFDGPRTVRDNFPVGVLVRSGE